MMILTFPISGVMMIVFTWRAENGRLTRRRWVLMFVPALFGLTLASLMAMAYEEPPPPPPPPSVDDMLDDPSLIDCSVLRPAAADAQYGLSVGRYDALTTADEMEYYKKVYVTYVKNCK